MKKECEIVKDLLPLYHDDVCSPSSKVYVETHLSECEPCNTMFEKMKTPMLDTYLKQESDDIIIKHTKKVKSRATIIGIVLALIMTIPILVSLIVNIAVGRNLDWFFIVLTGLMVAASLTVVPLVFEKNRGLITLGSLTTSLTLLLLVVNWFSGGSWFFVAVVPVWFGLIVIFGPFVLHKLPLPEPLRNKKGLISMTANTLFLYLLIIVIGLFIGGSVTYWRIALLLVTGSGIYPWVMFLIIRYLKVNGRIRASICLIFSGLFVVFIQPWIELVLTGRFHSPLSNNTYFDVVGPMITLSICWIIGGGLLIVGKKENEDDEKQK